MAVARTGNRVGEGLKSVPYLRRKYNSPVMSILKVARMGHPALRAKARAIDRADIKSAAVQRLIDDMMDTMIDYHGVGLAAPQVHEGLRLFVALLDAHDTDGPDNSDPVVVINPDITP